MYRRRCNRHRIGTQARHLTGAGVRWVSLGELILIGATAVTSVVAVTLLSRNGWFFGDAWDFLATRDLIPLTAGSTRTTVTFRCPWSFSIRRSMRPSVSSTSVVSAGTGDRLRRNGHPGMWYVMRRRGADPWIRGPRRCCCCSSELAAPHRLRGFWQLRSPSLALLYSRFCTPTVPRTAARREWVRLLA